MAPADPSITRPLGAAHGVPRSSVLCALIALLLLLATAIWAPLAQGREARSGGGSVTPAAEEAPTINKPANQTSTAGSAITPVAVTGARLASVTAKELPAGLHLEQAVAESEWRIAGTPTTPKAATTVTLEATDREGVAATPVTLEWTVREAAPTIAKPANQTSTAGSVITAVAVQGTNLAALTAEHLPAGLHLEDAGAETEWRIVGTPSTPKGATTVTLHATDKEGTAASPVSFEWSVREAAPTITAPPNQTSTAGTAITPVAVTGTSLASLTARELPPGLSLAKVSEGEWTIAGTPSTPRASTTVTLEATDREASATTAVSLQWTVLAAPAVSSGPSATGALALSPAILFSDARATCSGLTWSVPGVATRWLLDGVPIAGASSTTFVAPRSDDGGQLACQQTATSPDGLSSTLTSAPHTVHEQPPEPGWPIAPASERCATPVCIQAGAGAGAAGETYAQGSSWFTSQQVRCASAPWTSAAGDSTLPAVIAFAEAQAVSIELQRIGSSGPVTVAGGQLTDLGSARDTLDGSAVASPFPGTILLSSGSQRFGATEVWARSYPASAGKANWFAPGGSLLAYEVLAHRGVPRSLQLTYTLAAADRGAQLRCVVRAFDGAPGSSTEATFASAPFAVSANVACAPRRVAAGGPQPAVVYVEERSCVSAGSTLAGLGSDYQAAAVSRSHLALALACDARGGCHGAVALSAPTGPHGGATSMLARARVSARRGAIALIHLTLSADARGLLAHAGASGLRVAVTLTVGHRASSLGAVRLLAA